MFLVYCAILGLSFYALVGSVPAPPVQEVAQHFGPRALVRTTAAVLLPMGLGTIFHWLSESIHALLAGRVPQTILDACQSTEAVAVLDLAFGALASIIAAILLLWRKPLGFVLGPVLLTFLVLSSPGARLDGNVYGDTWVQDGLRSVRRFPGACGGQRRAAGVVLAGRARGAGLMNRDGSRRSLTTAETTRFITIH